MDVHPSTQPLTPEKRERLSSLKQALSALEQKHALRDGHLRAAVDSRRGGRPSTASPPLPQSPEPRVDPARLARDAALLEQHREALTAKAELVKTRARRQQAADTQRRKTKDGRRRKRAHLKADDRQALRAERAAIALRPPGPNLPQWCLRTPDKHVQGVDLDPFLADGWGAEHLEEWRRLALRAGVSPRLLPMLAILSWVHGFKGGPLGCGLQAPADWWARKLSCHRSHVYRLFAELEELELGEHFRQLRSYATRARSVAALWFKDENGVLRAPTQWNDGKKSRTRVDIHGVTYCSHKGIRLLHRRRRTKSKRRGKAGKSPVRKSEAVCGLWAALAPLQMRLRRRFAAAVSLQETPNGVHLLDKYPIYSATPLVPEVDPPPKAQLQLEILRALDADILQAELEVRYPWR